MANIILPAGGSGGAVLLRAEGLPGNHVVAKLGSKRVEGVIPEGGALQLKLPGLGLWAVDTETQDTDYHFEQEVKVYRYGITPCWAIAKKGFSNCTADEIKFIVKSRIWNDFGWQVGDENNITMLDDEVITVQIFDFYHDLDQYGLQTLPITLGMKNCFRTKYPINQTATNSGGWPSCQFRNNVLPEILKKFPKDWQDIMAPSLKITNTPTSYASVSTVETLFPPSLGEVFGNSRVERPDGTIYPIFNDDESRIRRIDGTPVAAWVRNPDFYNGDAVSRWYAITDNGKSGNPYANELYGVFLAFCVG